MWPLVKTLRWHHWARILLLILLADQAQRPLDFLAIATTDGVTLAIIGLLFAPIPTERNP